MNKLLYIGAGLDLKPLVDFLETTEFVFVDVQPRSEFDKPEFWFEGFYRNNFYPNLVKEASMYGFSLENTEELDSEYFQSIMSFRQRIKWLNRVKETFNHICPNLLTFYNYKTGQKLKYYISTNILTNMNWDLENDILNTDGLIISGFHPDKKLLNYITNPINLLCYSETCYNIPIEEVDNLDNLDSWLFNNPDQISKYFKSIFVVNKKNGEMSRCKDINQIEIICKKIHGLN